MILPFLVARDLDKKNPDLAGHEKGGDDTNYASPFAGLGEKQDGKCGECGKPLDDEDDEKKSGKGWF